MKSPAVLLLGASSQIGVFVIPRLLRAGFRVVAVSRKGRPQAYPGFEQVEWVSEGDARQFRQGCQHLVSAGPLALAQHFLGPGTQFQSAVIFSSSSVETKQASENPAERNQIEEMLALESQLLATAQSNGISLVILRPTLIYGCGLDTNISRLAGVIRRFGFMAVNGTASGLRQPVHADDLAAAAVSALLNIESLPRTLTLTGGSTLSYADMVRGIFTALGKPARLVHLPQWLFVLMVRLLSIVKPGWGINSEMVRRQRLDLVFDGSEASALLNYQPRAFAPSEEDFKLPQIRLER